LRNDERPDPDALLNAIEEIERNKNRGSLRIFLGMSAGVGKTYAMLRAAHQKAKEGVDVVVGVVETHGRAETLEQLEGLPTLARKQLDYRGTLLEEMDLDAILKRAPELVIVDELAHTNIPGSRHEKRYQDVIELLEEGIDVFTAFNVQHLESRKDAVEAITGIPIRETVPDSILELATQVELVDIAPAELLKRLKEGKIYLGDKAERAGKNFFKEDKLTALREIALRMTAERVDQDLKKFVSVRAEGTPWQTNERLLVAFSHSPYSEKLIRATRRLAYNLEAPWIAVYVDTGINLNDADQAQLVKNIHLARELNAELVTTSEVDIPAAVKRICRQRNVTQVVVGRPTRRWFRDIIEGGSLLKKLIDESLDVDVHIVRQERGRIHRPHLWDEISYYRTRTGLAKYWFTFCALFGVSLVGALIVDFIGYRSVGFVFLLLVIVIGMFGSIGAVIFAATMSGFIWNYFFIPPRFTLTIQHTDDALLCFSFFVVAIITGFLTNRIRFHEKVIREREERTNVLYEILQDISASTEKSEFLKKVTLRIGQLLNANCGVILKSPKNQLQFDEAKTYTVRLNEKDRAVAQWCFEKEKPAGWSTDTLSEARALYLPMRGSTEVVGVFVFQPNRKVHKIDLEKEHLILSVVQQLGVSIERHFLMKRLAEAQRLKDSEALHQTLLNSISHEIRTPLTAIMGAASALDAESKSQDQNFQNKIIVELNEAAERLNRVIENLLDMSRLNSGVLALNLEWHEFNDIVGATVAKLKNPLSKHKLSIEYFGSLVLGRVDFRLIEHAISNILLNATMYAPKDSTIAIRLRKDNTTINIEIEDSGPGIPDESLEKVFEKFYRIPGSPTGGTGLGLSIVKSIIELHKGQVKVENVQPHGAKFTILLPFVEPPEFSTESPQ
jgi:two-component system sensor histidine kinase KdpD